MAPDSTPPRSRVDAAASSRNAVRGGVLAALSIPPPAPAEAPPPAVLPEAPVQPPPPLPPAPPPPPPPRGFVGLLRAAGRRGLRAARPLAAPFLHRFQMRVRTAVDNSDVAIRSVAAEHALARLSESLHAEMAEAKRLAAEGSRRLDAAVAADAARSDATRREIAAVREVAVDNARRLDAVTGAAASNARRLDAVAGAAAEAASRQDAAQRRLDAIQQNVAALSETVHALATRRPPVPVRDDFLVYTPDGALLVPGEDLRFLAVIADGGVLETGTRRVLSALLRPGGVFLDVGANVGTMTLLGARAVGPTGRVFAVEPTPRVAALLRRSMAVNDVAGRVQVAVCAAGEEEGEALLHLEDVMSHNTLFPIGEGEGRPTARVPVRPADDLVPAGTAVDVAKIDVEGAELQVWRGMKRIIAESPDLSVVLEFGPSHLARVGVTPEAWLREVEAPGFEAFMVDEETGACRPATVSALAGVFSTNVLLLRPGGASRYPGLVFA